MITLTEFEKTVRLETMPNTTDETNACYFIEVDLKKACFLYSGAI